MGMCEKPNLIFNAETQRELAEVVKQANKEMADILGINHAVRSSAVKPDGNSAQLMGTSSGIHCFEARNYIRHIQINNKEQILDILKDQTPDNVEISWTNKENEHVAYFPVSVPKDALTLDDITAIEFLELVKLTQNNWIKSGTNTDHPSYKLTPDLTANVSNTCRVKDDEWDDVKEYLWNNRECFCGVSLLSRTGDLAYRQAPYTTVYSPEQLAEKYGAGAILAGGLIVDGLKVFDNLWDACDASMGIANHLLQCDKKTITDFIISNINDDNTFLVDIDGVKISDVNAVISNINNLYDKRNDWVRRFKKFAKTYMNNDFEKTVECLKRVTIFHKWNKSTKLNSIDWNIVEWENVIKDAGENVGSNCSGGKCDIVNI